jgi:hypothetical protein
MHANAQIFLDQLPTPATAFAGVARVNHYDTTASLFRFARRNQYEVIPRRIRNAFCQTVVFEHPVCIQVLKGQYAETVNQFPAFLVSEVASPVRYPLMHATDDPSAAHTFWRAFLGFREFARCRSGREAFHAGSILIVSYRRNASWRSSQACLRVASVWL